MHCVRVVCFWFGVRFSAFRMVVWLVFTVFAMVSCVFSFGLSVIMLVGFWVVSWSLVYSPWASRITVACWVLLVISVARVFAVWVFPVFGVPVISVCVVVSVSAFR